LTRRATADVRQTHLKLLQGNLADSSDGEEQAMRVPQLVLIGGLVGLAACSEGTAPTQPDRPISQPGLGDAALSAFPTPNITYHGGPALHNPKVAVIYWATTQIYKNGPVPGSASQGVFDKSLVGYFLNWVGGSGYMNILTTYYDKSYPLYLPKPLTSSLSYTEYWADNTDVPSTSATVSEASIQAEIVDAFRLGKLTYDANTIYAVFSAGETNLGGKFMNPECGHHSQFRIGGAGPQVIYAVMPYVYAYPNDPRCVSFLASPNSDRPANNEINVLAHELVEAVTDPLKNAWYDKDNQESADKCQLDSEPYGPFLYTASNGGRYNMTIGTKKFLIKKNWVADPVQDCALSY
jgi:hypothetical protein